MNKILIKNGFIIDGNGNAYENTNILIQDERITQVTNEDLEDINCSVIDATGLTVLPGFINAHVHSGYKFINNDFLKGFQMEYLEKCIQEGVTTIRDEGMFTDDSVISMLEEKTRLDSTNKYPRIVTTGKFFSAPGGYGGQAPIAVASVEDVQFEIDTILKLGVDQIKTVLEDGLDPSTYGLPKLSDELLEQICISAHNSGTKVSAHVTQSHNLERLVKAGIDDAGHMVYDHLSDALIEDMIRKNIFIVPTITVSKMIQDKYGAPVFESTKNNVYRFVKAGGSIAIGDDFIEEDLPWYRLGMPRLELELLKEAGLSNMDIIVAATKNGAIVCGLEKEIGTIETGKRADLLIVDGNPINNLEALNNVKMVLKDGNIIV